MFKGKTILVTGGTGSFGQGFVRYLLKQHNPKKVIVFSRDELKQFHMQKELSEHDNLRFFLGDIRSLPRLQRAFVDVDIVVHAAALKQVPALEYNPSEAVETNIIGSQNVITAAIDQNVSKVLLISTDKAVQPVNLYGATKMCAEKLFVASNVYSGDDTTIFSAVRYGNVLGSRGSVTETVLNDKGNTFGLTHLDMTRFWITLESCFALVVFALENMSGGEIFVPKVPSMKVEDLVKALAPKKKIKVVGMRAGEKIHEMLLTSEEAMRSYDLGDYFVILPTVKNSLSADKYKQSKKLEDTFTYTSDNNKEWYTKSDLRELLSL